jgi:hypothetical protein
MFTVEYVLPTCPKVLTQIISAMERTQGLLGTLEIVFDSPAFPVQWVFTIIELFNVVHLGTVFKCSHVVSIYA